MTWLRTPSSLIRDCVIHEFDSTRPSLFTDPGNVEHSNPAADRFAVHIRRGKKLCPRRYNHYYMLVFYQKEALTESGERYIGVVINLRSVLVYQRICEDSTTHYTLQNEDRTKRKGRNPWSVHWKTGCTTMRKNSMITLVLFTA